MSFRMRESCISGVLGLLTLLVTGCDFDRGDPYQSYDDVGEIDVEGRQRYYAARKQGRVDNGTRDEGIETAGQRHAHEVGEMSLDSETRPRAASKRDKAPAPKAVPAKSEKVSVVRPQVPAPVKAESKVVSAPAKATPAPVAPVRVVPAPAPAPEYRVPAVSLAPRQAGEDRYTHVRLARAYNQSSNVGEMEVGY